MKDTMDNTLKKFREVIPYFEGEKYFGYIKDNMDISRISNPTEEDYERLEKYKKVLSILNP